VNGDSSEPGGRRLLLDAMLGTLATYLRICGHDAAYALDWGVEDDDELRAIAAAEGRTLLTRDRELGARAEDAVVLESTDVEGQLATLAAAGLDLSPSPSTGRCGRCNGRLDRSDERPDHAPDEVTIYRCRDCGQGFWPGSHWEEMTATLAAARDGE